ncbi:MAG: Asp-tRNA(Asn)/Glu-tRNA(Gln) amidotransferase subunit GatC [Ruthenibacterium sp.]
MKADVKHIAKLAMLQFTDDEIAAFEAEFEQIIAMVDHLPDIESAKTLLDTGNEMELREDVIVPSYPRDEMLQNVPHTIAGCIVVPKTVE